MIEFKPRFAKVFSSVSGKVLCVCSVLLIFFSSWIIEIEKQYENERSPSIQVSRSKIDPIDKSYKGVTKVLSLKTLGRMQWSEMRFFSNFPNIHLVWFKIEQASKKSGNGEIRLTDWEIGKISLRNNLTVPWLSWWKAKEEGENIFFFYLRPLKKMESDKIDDSRNRPQT